MHYRSNIQKRLLTNVIMLLIVFSYGLFGNRFIQSPLIRLFITILMFGCLFLVFIFNPLTRTTINELWIYEDYLEMRIYFSIIKLDYQQIKLIKQQSLFHSKLKLKTTHKTYIIHRLDFPQFNELQQQLSKYCK